MPVAFSQKQIHAIQEKKKKSVDTTAPAANEPPAEAQQSEVYSFCSRCGHKPSEPALFCARCGVQLEEAPLFQDPSPEQQKNQAAVARSLKRAKWMGSGIGGFFVF